MVTGGLADGTAATQTRPLLPLLTRLPHAAGLDVLSSFRLMNFIYAPAAVVGNADIWRYLVFLLPVLAVLFASYVREHRPGHGCSAARSCSPW